MLDILNVASIFCCRAVDLASYANYENWYLAINPRGEVPVLQHGDEYIIDSNVIMEVKKSLNEGCIFLIFVSKTVNCSSTWIKNSALQINCSRWSPRIAKSDTF